MLRDTISTEKLLQPGEFEDVSFLWLDPPVTTQELYAVVDDNGTGTGNIQESDEQNNTISRTLVFNVLPIANAGTDQTIHMELSPKSSLLYPIMDASFPLHVIYTPQDGTQATLEPIGVSNEVFLLSENGGTLMDWEGNEYNPVRFKLTLEDGTVYIINQQTGIESITDPYGHQISYSDTQIAHFRSTGSGQASGDVLTIERDTSSRVERMTDQLGRTIEYHYDENGMLEQVIQQGEGPYTTRVLEQYAYQQGVAEQPVLKDILAPDGTRLGTFEYDSQGRKIGLIDHEGNRVLFGYDAPEHHYTVTDRRGNPTSYTYDSDGNVTSITDAEGHTETYSYDADGNVLAHTNKLGYTTASTYDEDGNVLTETDPLGNTSTFTYDEDGNKLTATDPLGHTTSFTYDAHGHVLTRQDALGHVTQFAYDEDGNLTATTNALNQTTSLSYDSQGNMLTKTDPLGNSVTLAYDLYGHVIQSQDEMGHVTTKEYDGQGDVRTITDALGHTTTMDYHHSGKVTEYTDAAGKTTQNTFDANGNLLTTTDPSGSVFGFEYDENEQPTITTSTITTANGVETVRLEKVYDSLNRVTEQIDADGLSTKAEYDALGRQTATIDKLGNRSEMRYDPRNLVTSAVSSDGSTETNAYDAAGRLIAKTDSHGNTTQHEYDAMGNIINTLLPNGVSVEHEYDALGRIIGSTSSLDLHTRREYDAAGRLVAETDTQGRTTRYTYYPDGKRKQIIDPRGNVYAYEYDAAGHQVKTTYPDGSTETAVYDEQGKQIAETDRLGHTTSFAWNRFGLLEEVADPLGHTTTFQYNEIGNLLSQTDANGHTTRFEYNTLGQRTGKRSPLGMSQTTQYDVEKRTITVKDFNGDTIVSEYDPLGRLAAVHLPDGSTMTYSYTSSGQVQTVSDHRGTTSYTYDEADCLLSRTEPDGTTVSYTYDNLGRRTSVTVPSGTTTYEYDSYGRLSSVRGPDGGETRYTYDEHGNKASTIFPNGIMTIYGYDTQNRVIAVEHQALSGTVLASYQYTLNAKGQRISVEEQPTGRTIDYEYDAAGRLIEERITDPLLGNRVISYTYDPVGNRMTKTENGAVTEYSYDDNDRLLTENGFSYTYDQNGNMLMKTGNGHQYDLQYNALNRLIRADITTPQGSSTVEYAYDHEGNRMEQVVDGTETLKYVVDTNRPYAHVLEERRTHGLLSAATSYVYGETLISQTTDDLTHSVHADGFGSTRLLSDASGHVTDSYAYDAYGMLLGSTGNTVNSYRYRGEQYDSGLDAYYLRARYYQPETGRFLTTDPEEGFVMEPVSQHRYLYGNSDPVNHVDPSGEMSLNEMLVSSAIIGGLNVGIGGVASYYFQDAYADFGEYIFPDAYIVGSSSIGVRRLTRIIAAITGYRLAPPIQGDAVRGFEALFSITSGEIAGYFVGGGAVTGAPNNFLRRDFKASLLYQGYVWNLWNSLEYNGPFGVTGFSLGSEGYALFSDISWLWKNKGGLGERARKIGSWGIARDVLGSTTPKQRIPFSFTGGVAYYHRIINIKLPHEFLVGGPAVLCSTYFNLLRIQRHPSPVSTFFLAFDITWWTQTTIAKYWWNKRSGYSIYERQVGQVEKRPDGFHSGPGLFILNNFVR